MMEEKAVVDRIEERQHAVLLVGEKEREFAIPAERFPEGAKAGSWLQVRVEGDDLAILGVDQSEKAAKPGNRRQHGPIAAAGEQIAGRPRIDEDRPLV